MVVSHTVLTDLQKGPVSQSHTKDIRFQTLFSVYFLCGDVVVQDTHVLA
jgi:hypothetical protein